MTTDGQTLYKLSSLVDMICHRLGLSVNHYFQIILEIAKWELMQLKLDRSQDVKTVLLTVSDTMTATLPSDAIDVTKVGVQFGQYVKTIGISTDLNKLDRSTNTVEFAYSVAPGWLPNGTAIQEYGGPGLEFLNYGGRSLYAVGGGLPHEGHYTVTKSDAGVITILLDGNVNATEIYVEYIGIGITPNTETILDPLYADYILKQTMFIWEQDRNPMRTEASIARRGREAAFAYSLVSGRTNSIDKDTLLLTIRKGVRLTNKS